VTTIRVWLCEADRDQYGGDEGRLPEELAVDLEALKDLAAGELEQLDRSLGVPVALFLEPMETWAIDGAQLRRVVAWLAVHLAGRTVSYADFQPRLLRATFTREVDERPPAGPSESSSEDAPPPSS